MYIGMLPETEQEQIVQALRGPQYDRQLHGALFDRGSADSYHGRPRSPHWFINGTGYARSSSDELTEAERNEYHAGYDYNEQYGDKKDWG